MSKVKQFKLTNNDEIVCEVKQWHDSDTEDIIVNFGLANILAYVKEGDNSTMMIGWDGEIANMSATPTSVSYTHLTLPTICSV